MVWWHLAILRANSPWGLAVMQTAMKKEKGAISKVRGNDKKGET